MTAQALCCTVLRQCAHCDVTAGRSDDNGTNAFSRKRIGHTDHSDVCDRRMLRQHSLDLQCRDVLRIANDGVLDPARHDNVAVGVDAPVAAAEPPVGVERIGVQGLIDVTQKALRPLESQLAFLSGPTSRSLSSTTRTVTRGLDGRPCGRALRVVRPAAAT